MDEAQILQLQEQIAQYYEQKLRTGPTISKAEDVAAWATAKFGSSRIEEMWALALDSRNRIFSWTQLTHGTMDKTAFYPREMVRWALLQDAVGVILIHNHPSGNNRPSDADLQMNRQAQEALKVMDIRLLDNIIITPEGKFYSFQQGGLL